MPPALLGWIGVLGLVALTASDLVLVWTPARQLDIYRAAQDKSDTRLVLGSLLGVFSIPLVLAGLVFIAGGLAPAGPWLAWPPMLLAGFAYVTGAGFHAVIGVFMLAIRDTPPEARASSPTLRGMKRIFDPLRTGLWVSILLSSLWLLATLLWGQTHYPRWVAAVSPFPLVLLCRAGARLGPPALAGALTPAGGNLATLAFLLASLAVLG